jgi:ParB-like chromosome segregation protein Spo0J
MMDQASFAVLKKDIEDNGLKSYLQFVGEDYDSAELVDGRNRLKALEELGMNVSPYIELIHPDDMPDPIAHVLSLNLHRRHLTESQRGMVASKVAKLKRGDNQHTSIDVSSSQAEAASMLNVSVPTVQRARKVEESAIPEIVRAVERGEITVSAAAEVAKLPKAEQTKVIAQGPKAVQKAAANERAKKQAVADKVDSKVNKQQPAKSKVLVDLRDLWDSMDWPQSKGAAKLAQWISTVDNIETIQTACAMVNDWANK